VTHLGERAGKEVDFLLLEKHTIPREWAPSGQLCRKKERERAGKKTEREENLSR